MVYSVPRNWMPQFKEAFSEIVKKNENPTPYKTIDLKDFPLVEIPAAVSSSESMAILISGDGGWGVTERGVSSLLASRGIPVAGLNSLHYFWKEKTQESIAKDLESIINHYSAQWKKRDVILIGYSLGADVMPFMINGLSGETKSKIKLAVFIGPSKTVDFQFHLTDWVTDISRKSERAILPELTKMKGMKMLFFYGESEKDSLCRDIDSSYGKIVQLPGGHRVGGKFDPIVDEIIKAFETR